MLIQKSIATDCGFPREEVWIGAALEELDRVVCLFVARDCVSRPRSS